jgi:hypothetical protein
MQRVADLTVAELRFIIQETVRETMRETDPDVGLELHSEIIELLSESVDLGDCISIEQLAAKHQFKW